MYERIVRQEPPNHVRRRTLSPWREEPTCPDRVSTANPTRSFRATSLLCLAALVECLLDPRGRARLVGCRLLVVNVDGSRRSLHFPTSGVDGTDAVGAKDDGHRKGGYRSAEGLSKSTREVSRSPLFRRLVAFASDMKAEEGSRSIRKSNHDVPLVSFQRSSPPFLHDSMFCDEAK